MNVFILMLNLRYSDSVVSVYSSKDDAESEAKRLMNEHRLSKQSKSEQDLRYYVITRDLIQ